ncbi:Hypothetical predicted protein, partial [Pelobates cultripes]
DGRGASPPRSCVTPTKKPRTSHSSPRKWNTWFQHPQHNQHDLEPSLKWHAGIQAYKC